MTPVSSTSHRCLLQPIQAPDPELEQDNGGRDLGEPCGTKITIVPILSNDSVRINFPTACKTHYLVRVKSDPLTE